MKKQYSSVVRRATVPESVGKPLVPPLSHSAVYYYDTATCFPDCRQAHNCVNNRIVSARYRRAFCVMHGLRP